ncbi:helix-turn-helix domain-containing protein [Kibdelosporangium phytohabitans]|uniref:HTH cro/C1-type domain-containing protein n=1 Tax=Kibdelosporangium phytohabitans TaxID=860235 RepID=A0A0N9HTX7_9PSEU|nr:helix-turn-helix domain-containing protein [Kibdelosporangium phytohabitans]ALG06377.1 hypothetical protein AOZ06_05060 [Kibdelosporangium phytohabitans]MBE1467523.1 transcriptional regulator with XRE-family HTH domain/tetratricopeptide (TPR) repeat protein [Kibdelosporangium phytohabitans]
MSGTAPGFGTDATFGGLLRELRKAKGWSLRELAAEVRYDHGYLGKLERGQKPPTPEAARACDRALNGEGRLLAMLAARPAQLPPVVSGFVGRSTELDTIRNVLRRDSPAGAPPVLLVSGPPGSGKTTLALKAAHDTAALYPDGQLYVDLRGYGPATSTPLRTDTALEEFLRALDVSHMPRSLAEKTALYRSILSHKRMLIVLDNAADLASVQPLLPASSSCATLLTSRTDLAGLTLRHAGDRITLGRMSLMESLALLRTVLGRRVDREYSAARALVDLCGRLPLAVRIAAQRAAGALPQPLTDLVNELGEEHRRLDALSLAGDESLAMRAVISWSYQKLEPEAAVVFRHLAAHRGPDLSVAAAAALVGASVRHTRPLLRTLASHHLIEPISYDRFRLHDLLRAFAASHHDQDDVSSSRADAAVRLVRWYLRSMRQASQALAPHTASGCPAFRDEALGEHETFTDDTAALAWCDAETGNLVPVIVLALEVGQADVAWQLALATRPWLDVRQQRISDALGILNAGVSAARHAHNSAAWARLEILRGNVLRVNGELDTAAHAYTTAVSTLRNSDTTHGLPEALLGVALIALEHATVASDTASVGANGQSEPLDPDSSSTELTSAREAAREALRLFLWHDDRRGAAEAMSVLADSDRVDDSTVGDPDRAHKQLTAALRMIENLDRAHPTRGNIHVRLSELLFSRGEFDAALQHVRSAVVAYRAAQDRFGVADARVREAEICQRLGNTTAMRAALSEAWQLYVEVLDVRATAIGRRLQATTPRSVQSTDVSLAEPPLKPGAGGSTGVELRRRATDSPSPSASTCP